MEIFKNPFRPGAGQYPPYLAGRITEKAEFQRLLQQNPVLQNVVLTGLRGVGKTVLLDEFKPLAIKAGWYWAGSDLSESASVSESTLATRMLADLAILTSAFTIGEEQKSLIGFNRTPEKKEIKLEYSILQAIHSSTPGLESDKLKRVLEIVWATIKDNAKGIVLAYDEAQILKDKAEEKQFPLSVLLEVVQYIQKKNIPYLLILTGLPTLYPNLVEARTYAERMFKVITLTKLTDEETSDAIKEPIKAESCPVIFTAVGISEIIRYSSGYPYFVQFFCREAFDVILQQIESGLEKPSIKIADFVSKLDVDFYSGRWNRITDRQKELLGVIAKSPSANEEFTVRDIVTTLNEIGNSTFKPTYINNLLAKLIEAGLIYKNRRGKYSFAVPLLADYIKRQTEITDFEDLLDF